MTRKRQQFAKAVKTVVVKAQTRKYVKKTVYETRDLPRRAKKEEAAMRIKHDFKVLQRTYSKRDIKQELDQNFRKFHSCLDCHYQTKSKSVIGLHKRRHKWPWSPFSCAYTLPFYKCYKCNYRTTLFLNLSLHKCYKLEPSLREHPKAHCCIRCDFATHSMLVLMKHSQQCMSVDYKWTREKRRDYYKCYQFLAQINYPNVEWLKCEKCSYMARLDCDMATHMSDVHATSSRIRWYECDNCLVNVEQIFHLRQHVLEEHGETVDDLEY